MEEWRKKKHSKGLNMSLLLENSHAMLFQTMPNVHHPILTIGYEELGKVLLKITWPLSLKQRDSGYIQQFTLQIFSKKHTFCSDKT